MSASNTRKRLINYTVLQSREERILMALTVLETRKEEFETNLLRSGIGGIPSGNKISRPTEDSALSEIEYFESYQRKKEKLQSELKPIQDEIKAIEEYIDAIPDEYTKEFFKRRYYLGESWSLIAERFHYSRSSWMIIQKRVDEYINRHDFQ